MDLLADGQILRIFVEMISQAVKVSNLHSYTDLGNMYSAPALCLVFLGVCVCVRVLFFQAHVLPFVRRVEHCTPFKARRCQCGHDCALFKLIRSNVKQNQTTTITQRQRSTQACVYFFVGVLLFLFVSPCPFCLALFSQLSLLVVLWTLSLLFRLTCTCLTHYTCLSPSPSFCCPPFPRQSWPFRFVYFSQFACFALSYVVAVVALSIHVQVFRLPNPSSYALFHLFPTTWFPRFPSRSVN